MPIKISSQGSLFTAEVTPPDGQWQTPHPMTIEELAQALRVIGCDREAASDAFMEALLQSYGPIAEELSPQVQAALRGEREVPSQRPFAEAWLTYALYEMDKPINIKELIENADSLDHLIPTADEISWALLQLRKRGWLLMQEDTYALTAEGRAVIMKVVGKGEIFEEMERLERWIAANPPGIR